MESPSAVQTLLKWLNDEAGSQKWKDAYRKEAYELSQYIPWWGTPEPMVIWEEFARDWLDLLVGIGELSGLSYEGYHE